MVRKGEIGRRQIQRQWPHRVELPAEAVRGPANSAATFGFAKELARRRIRFRFFTVTRLDVAPRRAWNAALMTISDQKRSGRHRACHVARL
jgi:hypothetical protein